MGTHKKFFVAIVVLMLLFLLPCLAAKNSHKAAPKKKSQVSAGKSSTAKALHGKKQAKSSSHAPRAKAKAALPVPPFRPSADLRPMGIQLMRKHTPEAYAGVASYARAHAGNSSGSLAWLAIGYARLEDKQYPQALTALQSSSVHAGELSDYVAYLTAQAYDGMGESDEVITALGNFDLSPKNSIFAYEASVLYAMALTRQGHAAEALKILRPLANAGRSDVELATGTAELSIGDKASGVATLRHIYYHEPVTAEAATASSELATETGIAPAAFAEKRARIAALISAGHWNEAATELRQLLPGSPQDEQRNLNAQLGIALHHLNSPEAYTLLQEHSPDAAINAQRLYELGELARSSANEQALQANLAVMRREVAHTQWFEQALLSAGNYYLLKKDYAHAQPCYYEASQQRPLDPASISSLMHWKAAWLSYRLGRFDEAQKLFEDQVRDYPAGTEIPAALYWRARLAEQNGKTQLARYWYAKCALRFSNYYYGVISAARLKHLSATTEIPADLSLLDRIPPAASATAETMQTTPPANDLRYRKSTLLANAGMTEFAVRELQSAGGGKGANWATLRIAQIFTEQDQSHRALYFLKKAVYGYYAISLDQLPRAYWDMLFPTPYWNYIQKYSAVNGLDPYLVASLIRQESEFNAGALSKANAYGLMQLLPSVGQQMGRELKMKPVTTASLVNPEINVKLGTHYFAQLLASYNGQVEYALAAYNGGANRVDDWRAAGNFRDVPEFVESIPFTETREYVQAILRNAKLYQLLYPHAATTQAAMDDTK